MTIQLNRGEHRGEHRAVDVEDAEQLVALRRNGVLSGVVGGGALILALAFLVRSASALDLVLGLGLLAVAALNLPAAVSARTPVLVADDYGIRLRIGLSWRGLPWAAIRQLVVEDRASSLREGRLVIVPRDREAVARRLGAIARWHLGWNQYWYGAALGVPIGMTTLIETQDLAGELADLAGDEVEVVHVDADKNGSSLPAAAAPPWSEVVAQEEESPVAQPVPEEDGEPVEYRGAAFWDVEPAPSPQPPFAPDPAPSPDVHAAELPLLDEPAAAVEVDDVEPVVPLREVRSVARVDVRLDSVSPVEDEPGSTSGADLGAGLRVVPEEQYGRDLTPQESVVVIDDLAPAPPAAPIIGAKIAHARECLDMSIEELSQRTRIRPHVLESLEVDDFGPCGGDFYARGHLTAVSRALGLDLEPLLETYDERYAQASIEPRRVFESDTSSTLSGGMRSTLSGPRWSLLIGSVLSLTMIWGLARIFAGDVAEITAAPPPAETAGLVGTQQPITSPQMRTTPMTVQAAYAATRVVVEDRNGRVLWSGELAQGQRQRVIGLAPFRVAAENAGAVLVTVKGKELGDLGEAGAPGSKVFGSR